jgi:hypothetical protein
MTKKKFRDEAAPTQVSIAHGGAPLCLDALPFEGRSGFGWAGSERGYALVGGEWVPVTVTVRVVARGGKGWPDG